MDSGFQTVMDSGSQQQKFAGFRILDSLTWGDLSSRVVILAISTIIDQFILFL